MAHPLCGADLTTLSAVFRTGGRPDRIGTSLGIWAAALARWPASALERAVVEPRLPAPGDFPPPLFVLGHWRSGTTHLANLLASGRWRAAGPLDVGLPWDMFGLARLLRRPLERLLPAARFVDRMPVTPDSPQEDEVALAAMAPLSCLHAIYFPREFERLLARALFFDGATPAEIALWEQRLIGFAARLAWRGGGPILIKNPAHTARPARLKRLFPGAKFIHIRRNPLDVFHSMRNFHAELVARFALQAPPADFDPAILSTYRRMMTIFDRETRDWRQDELVEISYESLVAAPLETLAFVYRRLDLQGFPDDLPRFRDYLASVEGYQTNRYRSDPAADRLVAERWAPWVARYAPAPSAATGTGP